MTDDEASRWVVLLRGINVGGANRLAMAELRATLAAEGMTELQTYVQSGNVVFAHPCNDADEIAALVAAAIERRHRLTVPVVVRTGAEMGRIAAMHPDHGVIEAKYLHVVFFDRTPDESTPPLDADRFAPDRFRIDGREAYVTYPSGSGRSKLTIGVFERAFGVTATARNMNSVRQLALMSGGATGERREKS